MTDWQDLTEEDAIEAAVAEHGLRPAEQRRLRQRGATTDSGLLTSRHNP
ncbi:hypothetical protein GOD93_11095 [Sinorhizobium medicae]|nr:hypothetical protein [Sinorhizobium medicae]